jgi:glycosyltransferase involved in cell wall biosynthesis
MSSPLVSVNMITYNHAPFIAQAIEGVLSQLTNFKFELLIGEDCSTDGTQSIVMDYAHRYPDFIRVVTSDTNVGMTKNHSRTISASTSKYLAFCEGDDFWQRTDKLQLQVDYLEDHPECGLVYSDLDWYYVESKKTIRNFLTVIGKEKLCFPNIEDIVLKKVDIRTCTALVRRDLMAQIIKADPFLHGSGHFKMGDTQLWAEMSLMSELHCIDDSLATYRIQAESATQSEDKVKLMRFWISDSEMYLYLCKKHNLPEYIKNIYQAKWTRTSLQLACYSHDKKLANYIKEKNPHFDFKDWIWYWGACNTLSRFVIISLKKCLGLTIFIK